MNATDARMEDGTDILVVLVEALAKAANRPSGVVLRMKTVERAVEEIQFLRSRLTSRKK